MIIRTILDKHLMHAALQSANLDGGYEGNLTFPHDCAFGAKTNARGRYVHRARIVPADSRKRGARYAPSGRHCKAASWEAHRDFMRAVYRLDPSAVFVTALARYDGSEHFERTFPATAYHRVGPNCAPSTFASLSIL